MSFELKKFDSRAHDLNPIIMFLLHLFCLQNQFESLSNTYVTVF